MAVEEAIDRKDLLVFWAKTDRSGAAPGYHPLVCHLIDVGMVAGALWDRVFSRALRGEIRRRIGAPDDESARRWLSFFAAMHDLGKLSPGFQLQNSDAISRIRSAPFPVPPNLPRSLPHGAITTLTLRESLPAGMVIPRKVISTFAAAVGGHHGTVPPDSLIEEVDDARSSSVGTGPWEAARHALTATIADVFGVSGEGSTRIDNAAALAVAGFVSVADWIGSNSDPDFFPFAAADPSVAPSLDLAAYAEHAGRRASRALERLGWTAWSEEQGARSFSDLFPALDQPRPVQQAVVDLADRLNGPSLVILEVPMGEGKTEAALYLADRRNAAEGGRGFYLALPTQATTNQMFHRAREFLARRYPDSVVDLQLLHGHATLSAEFSELRGEGDRLYYEVMNLEGDRAGDGASAAVVASEWFTYRKRGLLSPFGVGTVDQGLLAILQARHVFVRLFGLTRKVVVIDEVHAYDIYMSALLARLLEWLAALGSTVVLLSATLPRDRRLELARSYRRGLDPSADSVPIETREDYPRMTWLDARGSGEVSLAVSPAARKVARVRWVEAGPPPERDEACTVDPPFPLGKALREALDQGGCVAIVANTVGRAQAIYAALRWSFDDWLANGTLVLDLLHARFLFGDRDERERRTLARFGKPSPEVYRPFRAILVSTQIIEQSLDLDFDLLVTDVAPADLVLQRMGRLWRHERDNRRTAVGEPTVWLADLLVVDGVPRFRGGDARVYDPHVLLRSWLALRTVGDTIRVPEDVERLVDLVYADSPPPPDATEALKSRWEETRAERHRQIQADQEEARVRWVKHPSAAVQLWQMSVDHLEEDAPGFHRAHQALTRLADPSVTLICLFGTADRVYLDFARTRPIDLHRESTLAQTRDLLRSSLTVADRRVVWTLLDEEAPAPWRNASLLRHCRLRIFDGNRTSAIGDYIARLDPELGLTIVGREGGSD